VPQSYREAPNRDKLTIGVFGYGLAVIKKRVVIRSLCLKSMPSKCQPSTVVATIAMSVALTAGVGQRPESDEKRHTGRFHGRNFSVDCQRLLQVEHMLWAKQPPRRYVCFSCKGGTCEMLNEFYRMPTDLNPLPLQCPTWRGSRQEAATCSILLEQSRDKRSLALLFACTCD